MRTLPPPIWATPSNPRPPNPKPELEEGRGGGEAALTDASQQ